MESSLPLLFLLLLQLLLLVSSSPTALPYRPSYRYTPQYCRDAQTGREHYVGEVFTRPGQCMRVQCLGTLQLWEDSCQVPRELSGDCTAVPLSPAEEALDYPKCCPLFDCKTYESNSQGEVEQTNTYDHYGNLRKSYRTEVIKLRHDEVAPIRQYNVGG